MTRPARLAGAGLAVTTLALGGCAERGVVAAPAEPPGTGTWVAVWLAGVLAAVVLGTLLTLPCWTRPDVPLRDRLVAALLALQSGAAAVVGILLLGFAVRSWQLVERPFGEAPAAALVRISRIDGDGDLFALLVLAIVLLGGLVVWALTAATRMLVLGDSLERWVVVTFLGLQILGASTLAVLHVIGFGGWPYRSGLVALPLLIAAFTLAWPQHPEPARP